jgi:hypothetical protein
VRPVWRDSILAPFLAPEPNGLNSRLNFLCKRFCGRRAISV